VEIRRLAEIGEVYHLVEELQRHTE